MSKRTSLLLIPAFGCFCALATTLIGTRTSQSATLPLLRVTSPTVQEGTATQNHADFVFSLQNVPGAAPANIHYSTGGGTATAKSDYTPLSGNLTLAPGQSATVSVPIVNDSLDEDNETFQLNVTASGATPTTSQATATIVDDDSTPTLSVNDVAVNEIDSGNNSAQFSISLSAPSGRPVTVSCATADGTALAGSDYTAYPATTVTFSPGQTTRILPVAIHGDTVDERDEKFYLNLTHPTNATISRQTGTATIIDNDTSLLKATVGSVKEGNSGTVLLPFTLSLSNPTDRAVSLKVSTATASTSPATAGVDYVPLSLSTVTFAPGETRKIVNVTVNGDTMDEDDENVDLVLGGTVNSAATVITPRVTGVILDDDNPPTLRVNDVSVTEGDVGTTTAKFNISLSAVSGHTVTVQCATSDGSAQAGSDYVALAPTTVTFNPGQLTQTVSVTVNNDLVDELNETFNLVLSSATNATIADGTGVATIIDNDTAKITATGGTVVEGDSGTALLPFTLSLSHPSDRSVSVKASTFTTAASPATARVDYVPLSATTVTFAPGETTETVNVTVNGDTLNERNENVGLVLSNAVNASLVTTQVTGTIQDDDAVPSLSVNDISISEGNSGTVTSHFTISLSAASGVPVTVNYATSDDTATAGSDYTALPSTPLTFSPGQTTRTVNVSVQGDTVDELNEAFDLVLSDPTNATIADGTGVATIVDNDSATLSATGGSVTEGDSDTVLLPFTVKLSTASDRAVSVQVQTNDAATAPATADVDYVSLASTTVTFAPGEISKTVNVTVNGDLVDEDDENVGLTLSSPVNATIATSSAVGTIVDDDSAPSLSVNDISITEGNSNTQTGNFTISLSAPSSRTITVNYATADGTASSSPTNADYQAISSTSLSFAPGETSKTVTVTVKGDTLDESDETFDLVLSSPTNATITDDTGVATIVDDDVANISVSDASITEGDSGTINLTFTGHVVSPSDHALHVSYVTTDDTAASGSDYVAQDSSLTVYYGGSFQITVPIIGDTTAEDDETFKLNLTSADANITTPQVIGTIVDNDSSVPGKIAFVSTRLGLNGVGGEQIYVMNADGTNQTALTSLGNNYFPRFNADGSKIVFVSGRDFTNNMDDKDEIYIMNADGTNQTRLTNNTSEDTDPNFSPDGTKIIFASNRTGSNQLYTMNLDGTGQATLARPVAGYEPSYSPDGTKITYSFNDQIYIAEAHGFSQVRLTNNTAVEYGPSFSRDGTKIIFNTDRDGIGNHEIYTMNIDGSNPTRLTQSSGFDSLPTYSPDGSMIAYESSPSNSNSNFDIYIMKAAGGPPRQLTTNTAADMDPSWAPGSVPLVAKFSSPSVSVTEGNSGSRTVNFQVSLSAISAQTVTVDYTTQDVAATAGSDYTATSGTLTFPAGTYVQQISIPVLGDTSVEGNESFHVVLLNPTNAQLGAVTVGTVTILDDDTSPLSGKITFVSNRDGNNEIYVMNADGTQQTRLTNNTAIDSEPRFSKDGGKIVFTSKRDGNNEIYVMNADGSNQTRLTNNTVDDTNPSFSSDGSKIVFISTRDGNPEIYTMNVDGSNPLRLTSTVFNPTDHNIGFDEALPSFSLDGTKIVYSMYIASTSKYQLYIMNADGTQQTQLLTSTNSDNGPSFSPNGNEIVFYSYTGSESDIDVVNSDGTGLNRVTTGLDRPVFSPDNGWLAFGDGTTPNIYIAHQDGSGRTQLTTNGTNTTPSWAPGAAIPALNITNPSISVSEGNSGSSNATFTVSLGQPEGRAVTVDYATQDGTATAGSDYTATIGTLTFPAGTTTQTISIPVTGDSDYEADESFTLVLSNPTIATLGTHAVGTVTITNDDVAPPSGKIAFASSRNGLYQIYVMNADGTNQTALTSMGTNFIPRFNAAGSKIVFTSNRDFGPTTSGEDEIYIMNADGTNQTRLTNNTSEDSAPSFSPDGTQIIFVSNRGGSNQLYTMNIDGTGQAALPHSVAGEGPSYSPDGTKITYTFNDQIYSAEAHGFSPTRLTNNTASEYASSFSPDGTKILFNTDRDGNHELYTMNSDGSNQTRLTNNTTPDLYPVYSPDGAMIAYASSPSNGDSNFDIYIMSTAGGPATKLTTSTATDTVPSWAPGTVPAAGAEPLMAPKKKKSSAGAS